MTRYAVGDIQGCLQPLQCLLKQVDFVPSQDQLWLVGDLVNRGPDSLETLRTLKALHDRHPNSIRIVLGNHDLHFLAVAHKATQIQPGDTLDALLDAEDLDDLVNWLRHQPLIYTDPNDDYTMVHAGIPPMWTLQQAHLLAREVENVLQSDTINDFFAHMYGNEPSCWDEALTGWPRLRLITNYFTRMRFCHSNGTLNLSNKSDQGTPGTSPWFSFSQRQTAEQAIIFGHWAALEGKTEIPNIFALDTGCVWGKSMTLLDLDKQTRINCHC